MTGGGWKTGIPQPTAPGDKGTVRPGFVSSIGLQSLEMLPRMIAAAIAPLTAAGVLAPTAAILAVYQGVPALTTQIKWVTFAGVAISYVVTFIATLTVIPMLHTCGHVRLAHYTAAGATIGGAVPALIGGLASSGFRDVGITALFGFLSGVAVAGTFWKIEQHLARAPK